VAEIPRPTTTTNSRYLGEIENTDANHTHRRLSGKGKLMATPRTDRANMLEAIGHRYLKDPEFQRGVPNPGLMAAQLFEIAERIRKMHAEKLARARKG